MKKITGILAVLTCFFVLCLGFISCDTGGGISFMNANDGSDGYSSSSSSVAGTYTAQESEMGYTVTYRLVLNPDSTYIVSYTIMGYTEIVEIGTYSVSGNTITFYFDGGTDTGTISGNTIQYDYLILTKQ